MNECIVLSITSRRDIICPHSSMDRARPPEVEIPVRVGMGHIRLKRTNVLEPGICNPYRFLHDCALNFGVSVETPFTGRLQQDKIE